MEGHAGTERFKGGPKRGEDTRRATVHMAMETSPLHGRKWT